MEPSLPQNDPRARRALSALALLAAAGAAAAGIAWLRTERDPLPSRAAAWRPLPLNRASYADLLSVPGMTPRLARAILAERDRRGGRFERVEELDAVPGVGPKTLERLQHHLQVAPENADQ